MKMFSIEHNNPGFNIGELIALYDGCGWNADGFRNEKRTELALRNSLWYCSAYLAEDDRLVGFARLVGDGVYVTQLVDLMVSAPYRNRGLARQIVSEISTGFNQQQRNAAIMLVDGSGISDLYTSLGFLDATSEQVYYQVAAQTADASV